jgi:hypothetical protein
VLVILAIIVAIVIAGAVVRVMRRDGAEKQVAAFDEGQQALRRASNRSSRSS